MGAKCVDNYTWRIHAGWTQKKKAFMVKIYVAKHRCARPSKNRQASSKWIANYFLERLTLNPRCQLWRR